MRFKQLQLLEADKKWPASIHKNIPLPIPKTALEIKNTALILPEYYAGKAAINLAPLTPTAKKSAENYTEGVRLYITKSIKESGFDKYVTLESVTPVSIAKSGKGSLGYEIVGTPFVMNVLGYRVYGTFYSNTYPSEELITITLSFMDRHLTLDGPFKNLPEYKTPLKTSFTKLSQEIKKFVEHMVNVYRVPLK